ncbi:MAG: hypothetical protein SFY68_06070, partial [Candidatus Sumerlaeia bacterium]|nr:hypothetical protein [Candidatus Sumerlaeia bacterium]
MKPILECFFLIAGASYLASVVAADCSSPLDLTGDTLPVSIEVSTVAGPAGAQPSCALSTGNGPDRWIALPEFIPGTQYEITTGVLPSSVTQDTRLALYLGDCDPGSEVLCADDTPNSTLASLSFVAESTGPYFLLLDTPDAEQFGEWSLTIQEFDGIPTGSTCAFPENLSQNPLPIVTTLDLSDGFNTSNISCAADEGGADRWYLLPSFPDGKVCTITTEALPEGSLVGTRLEVFSGETCNQLIPVACSASTNAEGEPGFSTLSFLAQAGEQYHLLVEASNSGQTGPFQLRIETTDRNIGTLCDTPIDFSATAYPFGTQVEVQPQGSNSADAFCAGGDTGADTWFQLPTVPVRSVLTIVVPNIDTTVQKVFLELFREDCNTSVACSSEADAAGFNLARIDYVAEPGVSYKLLIDSEVGAQGIISVAVYNDTPPPAPINDLCENATAIPASELLTYQETIEVLNATDSGNFAGEVAPSGGVDALWSFTPAATGRYFISSEFIGEGDAMALGIWTSTDCLNFVPLCESPIVSRFPFFSLELTQRETVYIILDDPDPSTVPLQYSLTVQGLIPGEQTKNSTCENAEELTLNGGPVSFTADPTFNTSTVDLAPGLGFGGCRGELWYKYTPAANTSILVDATNFSAFQLFTENATGGCGEAASNVVFGRGVFDLQGGVPVYLAFESTSHEDGPLDIVIEEILRPENDNCSNGQFITSLPYEEVVDFALAQDEGIEATCAFDDRGFDRRDLFWSFVPAASGNYRITAQNADPRIPVDTIISLYTDCSVPVVCKDDFGVGETENLAVALTEGIEYQIAVEVSNTLPIPDSQPVRLSIESIPNSTGNDSCPTAEALLLTGTEFPYTTTFGLDGNTGSPWFFEGPT